MSAVAQSCHGDGDGTARLWPTKLPTGEQVICPRWPAARITCASLLARHDAVELPQPAGPGRGERISDPYLHTIEERVERSWQTTSGGATAGAVMSRVTDPQLVVVAPLPDRGGGALPVHNFLTLRSRLTSLAGSLSGGADRR